ncbi:myotubularin-related protein 6/7/8 [Emericellopsis cladophorae]|uniref:Myotubularin-related protein 6/7/8 n=1 Tax=Emericellopsis cladophorae TaxID=2686198 RepID=A0A9P9XXJ7_9HYPO|nr:myotubularin-related protein 6/7/8 [Emericellopsis cladophorae]KAI6779560.1 myotubularin-related protein 6/7/8 [Emericellopsis cladophorae]
MDARLSIEGVSAVSGGQTNAGKLRLTDFHLVFCAPVPNSTTDPSEKPRTREKWIPFPMISNCVYRPVPPGSRQPPTIRLRCRDFTFIAFNFTNPDSARDTYEFIRTRTCKLGTVEKLYAFSHKPLKNEKAVDGWNFYDPKAEFRRQGISEKLPDKGWRVTNINHDYSFCDTYPAVLVVPSKISDNVLKYARDFRSRNRIPALSYIHPINNCTITRSSQPLSGMTRKSNVQDEKLVAASFSASVPISSEDGTPTTSQHDLKEDIPSATAAGAPASDLESLEDDMLANSKGPMWDEKTGKRLIYGAQQNNLIVDARPTINAMVNHIQGMGTENMDKYKFASKAYLSIGNIHVMRKSLKKVVDALKDTDLVPLGPAREMLHQSDWLRHTRDVLDGASIIVRQIGYHHSHVLIHCSDGWDRTSQLSALAQIMLDPFFRTIDGFITVVEKDWLSFGHMFRLRSGHLNHESWFSVQKDAFAGSKIQPGESDDRNDAFQNVLSGAKRLFNQSSKDDGDLDAVSEQATGKVVNEEATTPNMTSPVFHQFLECVYQLLRQFPDRFEYNERFLRRLLYHLYSCQYGTFLYNSEKQRKDARVAERTSSVWDYFLCRRQEFTNPQYDPNTDDHVKDRERIIFPNLTEVRWWHQLYGRTDDEMNGALNAAATAEQDRQAAISSLRGEGTPRSSTSTPQPPGLGKGHSVLAAVETAHETLTPDDGTRSRRHSASAEDRNAFTALKDGIAGLGLGKGMLGNVAPNSDGHPNAETVSTHIPAPQRSDQELRDMT